MTRHLIFEARYWSITHRRDARYPGYLMVSSREPHPDLCDLSPEALTELGNVLKQTEALLRAAYTPLKVLFYKLGFSPGFSCHFHVTPVVPELITEVASHPDYPEDPDGNDVILFLSRIYCERELTDAEDQDQQAEVSRLRSLYSTQCPSWSRHLDAPVV